MLSNSSTNIIEKEFENLRKELLDLTLRNQLLNFKSRAKTVSIKNQTPINVYQTLVLQENKMYFVANKKDKKEEPAKHPDFTCQTMRSVPVLFTMKCPGDFNSYEIILPAFRHIISNQDKSNSDNHKQHHGKIKLCS